MMLLLYCFKEALNKSFLLMVRQAHHERNQYATVHPELVEGFNQRFLKAYDVRVKLDGSITCRIESGSNTESLIMLNVETQGDSPAVSQYVSPQSFD